MRDSLHQSVDEDTDQEICKSESVIGDSRILKVTTADETHSVCPELTTRLREAVGSFGAANSELKQVKDDANVYIMFGDGLPISVPGKDEDSDSPEENTEWMGMLNRLISVVPPNTLRGSHCRTLTEALVDEVRKQNQMGNFGLYVAIFEL